MSRQQEVEQAVRTILTAIGEDPEREGLRATPHRVARMMDELFSGVGLDAADAIDTIFDLPDGDESGSDLESAADGEMVVFRELSFFSMCEHHLLPFFGKAYVGYVPNGRIADAVYRSLQPDGVAVVMEAEHLCMSMRGVRKPGSTVVTTAARGPFARGVIGSHDFLVQLQGQLQRR